MGIINILDDNTINLIAAGEVVEKPASVIKELVENSIDSGADKITIEIKQGGIEFIRVTDNGKGIASDDVRKAFYRHATSKIKNADDILGVLSMGFRGEALSSISAVSKVEMITKRPEDFMGTRYVINGGKEGEFEEVGAPDGTTIIVRNLFYNTPARRKFLKSELTEGNAVYDVCQHLALGRPDIAFRFINNGKEKISTTGKSDIKELIYRLFGKETSDNVIPIDYEDETGRVSGYLGKPSINRPNRNFETYFINNRFIKNNTVSSSIEEAYSQYLMQHKFPFCVLHFDLDVSSLDVNVHPAKLEVRITGAEPVHDFIVRALSETLSQREMIPSYADDEVLKQNKNILRKKSVATPEQFEIIRSSMESEEVLLPDEDDDLEDDVESIKHGSIFSLDFESEGNDYLADNKNDISENVNDKIEVNLYKPVQLSFIEPEERVLSEKARKRFKIIGQIFDTYWIIEYSDSVYFIDQHAAHEKVNFERLIKKVNNGNVDSQNLYPPIIVTMSGSEMSTYKNHKDYLEKVGFITEEFGGNEVSLRAIPLETYYNAPGELFLSIIDDLSLGKNGSSTAIETRVATMACKASVKGGNKMSISEIEELIDELLTLDNPYNCPHGRPTIFSMSKSDIEKKFKRIVN